MMKRFFVFTLALLVLGSLTAFASVGDFGGDSGPVSERSGRDIVTLDEQCTIDFIGFTYGSRTGHTHFPGGDQGFRLTGFCFVTLGACGSLPDTFYTYCTDVNHNLMADPYCVDIDEVVVRPLYPLQYPAMAYLMTWYSVTTELEDRIMQLTVWKTSNDHTGGANDGIPFYHIDDNRGYPDIADPPLFPLVNTIYNSDAGNNDPANDRVLDALGFDMDLLPTGIAKNVIIDGDQLQILADPVVIEGGFATVCLTVTLERGPHALNDLNNASVSGVRLLFDDLSGNGTLSVDEAFTDVNGQAEVCISQPVANSYDPVEFQVCSYGLWPSEIVPCELNSQRLLVQIQTHGAVDTLCEVLEIPGDNWLAVELASFAATTGNGEVTLNWTTASESDNDYFDVLRDGTIMGRVQASNSATGSDYSWTDYNLDNGREYNYTLVSIDINGIREEIATTSATPTMNAATVTEYALHQNYPNPFNPETNIAFDLVEAGEVMLTVYNPLGQKIAMLVSGSMPAGRHTISFHAGDLPSGIYFYRIDAGDFTANKKMILMK